MGYKLSYYNFYLEDNESRRYIYNARQDTINLINASVSEEDLIKSGVLVKGGKCEMEEFEYTSTKEKYCHDTLWLTINPTMACNFRCPYCFVEHAPKTTMDRKTADRLIEFIYKRLGTFRKIFVLWFGGEPTLAVPTISYLSNHLISMCSLHGKKYEARCITNGYKISHDMCKEFKRIGITSIQVTIDGDREAHNRTRFTKTDHDTYTTIMGGIKIAQQYFRRVDVRINTAKSNVHSVTGVLRDLKDRGLDTDNVRPYLGQVTGRENGKNTEDTDFFDNQKFAKVVVDFEERAICDGCLCKDTVRSATTHRLHHCMTDLKNSYVVGAKGELYKCIWDIGDKEFELGTIFDEENIELDIQIHYMMTSAFKDPECRKCKFISLCSGGCLKRTELDYKYRCCVLKEEFEKAMRLRMGVKALRQIDKECFPMLRNYPQGIV